MQGVPINNVVAKTEGNQTIYTKENGEKLQGIQKVTVDGKDELYYFNDDSTIYCGWMKDENNNFHYFTADGRMAINRYIAINEHLYKINEKGELDQNVLGVEERQFVFDQSRVKLQTADVVMNNITGTWSAYILNPITGQRELAKGLTKLVQEDGINTYYFDENGIMQMGWLVVNGKPQYFSPETGKLIGATETNI